MTTPTAPPTAAATGVIPLLDRVPVGETRVVVDAVASELGLSILSELTWADPPVLGLRPGVRPVTRVSRAVLGRPGSEPEHAFAYVERSGEEPGVVVGANESYPVPKSVVRVVGRARAGAAGRLGSGPRGVLREAAWTVLVTGPHLPWAGTPASSEDVAELTRLVLGRGETLAALTRLTGHPVDELPVLVGEPSRSVVGGRDVVARHLAFARALAAGAPEEWAARRYEDRP